jgi:ABC-type amino acid transport substrate-binding protein
MHTTTVNHCMQHGSLVPMIRLRGGWLERVGFAKGEKLTVDVLLGTLSLTLTRRAPKHHYSVPEAQAVLAVLAARLAAIVAGLEEVHDGLPAPELEDDEVEDEIVPDLAAEFLGAIEAIVGDCLAPAIESLEAVAKLTEEQLLLELQRERARVATVERFRAVFAPSDQLELALTPVSAASG